MLHFLYLNFIPTAFCVNHGKVMGLGAGKGFSNIILFETVA